MRDEGQTFWPVRVAALVMRAARPHALGWSVLAYYLTLILLTDGVVWYMAKRIGTLSWHQMALYSLFSYPLWMLIGIKGLVREQSDMIEQGRWHAIDLLPGGVAAVVLGHHLGKTVKTRALWAWLLLFVVVGVARGVGPMSLVVALAGLACGSVNLLLAAVLTRIYSPKGYSGVLTAIFYSATAIASGSAFPLELLGSSVALRLLNPFHATVSMPLQLLMMAGDGAGSLAAGGLELIAAAAWCLLLFAGVTRAERTQRARIYS